MVDENAVRKALRKVKDPELDLDLVVLGLIYGVDVNGDHVDVTMSLTTPMCPAADQIVADVKREVEGLEGVDHADVQLTFDPPWSPEKMDPLIRASLGL
jgi:metal-sulfur cluster biosynthetic enzyme